MKDLFKFIFYSNLAAAVIATLGYFIVPFIGQQKIVDILFIIGLLFWAISSLTRLGNRRYKTNTNSYEVVINDPQHIMRTDHLATRLLIAGIPWLATALIVGFIFY